MTEGRASSGFVRVYRIVLGVLAVCAPTALGLLRTGRMPEDVSIAILLYFAIPYALLLGLSLLLESAWTLVPPVLGVVGLHVWTAVAVASSESSTAALALLFVPLWQVVLAIPAGVVVGGLLWKATRGGGSRRKTRLPPPQGA